MADLAKLVVRLEAQSAQLLSELDRANNRISRFERSATASLTKLNKRFSAFGGGVKSTFALFLGGLGINAIIKSNEEAADSFANLENAVERAGISAGGRSAKEFAKVALQLSNITTNSDEAVQGVQNVLLRFQNIRVDRFDEATKTVLNFAAAMRKDVASSAELVGKALADPIKGVTQLARAGVNFSAGQKALIKDLVETGRRAEAQGLILDGLAKRFDGAAEKARDTFGGALKGLKNAFGELMENEGGLPGATKALNEFTTILQDPGVKDGADALFTTIVTLAAEAAKYVAQIASGLKILSTGKGANEAVNVDNKIRALEAEREKRLKRLNQETLVGQLAAGAITAQYAEQIQLLEKQFTLMTDLNISAAKALEMMNNAGTPVAAVSTAFELPDIEVFESQVGEEALKALEKLQEAGKALTESLRTPYEVFQDRVKQADALLKANVITVETWKRAIADAADALDPMLGGLARAREGVKNFDIEIREEIERGREGLEKDILESAEKSFEGTTGRYREEMEAAQKAADTFRDQAIRNTQDILADGISTALEDGFDKGAEGALDAFGKMLTRMAAQALAAKIGEKLFGTSSTGSSGSGTGGLIDKGIEFLGNIFGGKRDSGGSGKAGRAYMIGRGVQPEMFVPDTDGEFFTPAQYGGGRQSLTQNIYTTSPMTQRTARQIALETSRRQMSAQRRLA